MKQKIFFILILFIVSINCVSAAFTWSHAYWTYKGLQTVDSPVVDLCENMPELLIDGNTAADIPVLHYFDNQYLSYISTHTAGSGFMACGREAGTDAELKCFCFGDGTHITQDVFFHGTEGQEGLVEQYLRSQFMPNFIGHMVVEQNFLDQHIELVRQTDGQSMVDTIDRYAGANDGSLLCNSLFSDPKYFTLLEEMSGIDMRNDANIFCNGYKGSDGGFFNTVYDKKVEPPYQFLSWAWIITVIGLTIIIALIPVFYFKIKSFSRYILAILGIIFLLTGMVVLTTYYTNTTWKVTTFLIKIPPKFGLLTVSHDDVVKYNNLAMTATENFYRTGQLAYEDASGLSYTTKDGRKIVGTLKKASSRSTYLFGFIGFIVMLFVIWLAKNTFFPKKR